MRTLLSRYSIVLAAILFFPSIVFLQGVQSQQEERPKIPSNRFDTLSKDNSTGGPAPVHDLNGAWAGPTAPTINPVPPLTPLGQRLLSLNKPEGPAFSGVEPGREVPVALSNDPLKTCDPQGFPRAITFEDRGIQFIQTPTAMWEMFQYQKVWREIWTDGRALPKNVGGRTADSLDTRYYGYSVGHWDGDYAFVVDTVGMDPKTWIDNGGHPHSVDLQVEERYQRLDRNDIEVTVTIDDPKIYTRSFVITQYKLRWIPEQEFEEQLCVPSEMLRYEQLVAAPAGDPNAAKR